MSRIEKPTGRGLGRRRHLVEGEGRGLDSLRLRMAEIQTPLEGSVAKRVQPGVLGRTKVDTEKVRLSNMPGVVEWLIRLRDDGPQKRGSGRSGASARSYGLTDYWVRHRRTGRWMFLQSLREKEAGNPEWYTVVDYGDSLEAITPKGRTALQAFLEEVNSSS